jgi:acetyltransferase-like isoleucine patch superfamily enzyme
MRENIIQNVKRGDDQRIHVENDWFPLGLPSNANLANNVYLDTSYGFSMFYSGEENALRMDEASGCYDVVSFMVNHPGKISVGKYSMLNGTTIICNKNISIGEHCMLAWGSIVTDTWLNGSSLPVEVRKKILLDAANDPLRKYPVTGEPKPVILEDNCWIGFDAIIMPGVKIGRGSIVGCKTVITEDVPAYAVVAGSPARIVRFLNADDTEFTKNAAMERYITDSITV